MSLNQRPITVKSKDAFDMFKKELLKDDEKDFAELVELLKEHFPGINYNQCSGIINRAHNPRKGHSILIKNDDLYSLNTKKEDPENEDGLEVAKEKIKELIVDLEQTPASQFESSESFSSYLEILRVLKKLQ